MSRTPAAVAAISAFVLTWVIVAVLVADWMGPVHWAVQAVYFVAAGTLWVLPVRWLMLWAARLR